MPKYFLSKAVSIMVKIKNKWNCIYITCILSIKISLDNYLKHKHMFQIEYIISIKIRVYQAVIILQFLKEVIGVDN